MSQVRWKKLILTLIFWAIAEFYCSLIGLDDYIDYGEFIFAIQETTIYIRQEARYRPAVVEHKALIT